VSHIIIKICQQLILFYSLFKEDPSYKQEAAVVLGFETHGGEDVPIYSSGPMSFLFAGTVEQSYIAHAMAYSACIGVYDTDDCRINRGPYEVVVATATTSTTASTTISIIIASNSTTTETTTATITQTDAITTVSSTTSQTVPNPFPSSSTSTTSTLPQSDPTNQNLGAIIGGSVGGVAGILFIGFILYFFVIKKKKDRVAPIHKEEEKAEATV
jgi:hypothetical protein